MVGHYVVEEMLPVNTVDSPSFRTIISKIPTSNDAELPHRTCFSSYLDKQYETMEANLKAALHENSCQLSMRVMPRPRLCFLHTTEVPMNELNTLCTKLGVKCFKEREYQFLNEYCTATKPLTVALDILQADCPYGTLLPTLEVLMQRTLAVKDALSSMTAGLPDAIVQSSASVANTPVPQGEMDFFNFEAEPEETYSAEKEVMNYLSSSNDLQILHQFANIKKIFMKYNTPTPSSAPVNEEFLWITTKPLQTKFLAQLDHFSEKLFQIFESKGGVKGQKIKRILAIKDERDNINIRRECVLKSLIIYLNDDPDSLFKEFLPSAAEDAENIVDTVMGIHTVRQFEEPDDIGVVIEGVKVLNNVGSATMAFIMLFGLIYALDLSFPDNLKYTFEFVQKILMNLDGHRLNTKIQQLKIKLFM
ncbi:unnamed protein product [Merluccius merluccius]